MVREGLLKRVGRGASTVGLMLLFLSAGQSGLAGGSDWSKLARLTKGAPTIVRVDSDVGPRGFAVVAWSQVPADAAQTRKFGTGMVRVKPPGHRRFTDVLRLGRVAWGPEVSIGDRGHTVLAWSSPDQSIYFMRRGPRTKWSSPQRVPGTARGGAVLDVGPDGTAVLFSTFVRSVRDPQAHAIASVMKPGSTRFLPWQRVSRSADSVGFRGDAIASTKGRATVVWGGPCPLEGPSARDAVWVDLKGRWASRPQSISNSKCPAFDLDLERDNSGHQYLKVGGSQAAWLGVKLAVREPGKHFPRAELVSPADVFTDGGNLTVDRRGRAFVSWRANEYGRPAAAGYEFATYRHQNQIASGPIEGVHVDRTARMDIPGAFAFDPNGNLSSLWIQHWVTGPRNDWRFRVGTDQIDPLAPTIAPAYDYGVAIGSTPGNLTLNAARDGSQLAVWEMNRKGHPRSINWMELPRPR